MLTINEVAHEVVDASDDIYTRLGSGLIEGVYRPILADRLGRNGLVVKEEVPIPIEFEGRKFREGFRADLIVENCVVVELKSIPESTPFHAKKLLTYVRLLDFRLGLLINFGAPSFKNAVRRIVNGLEEDCPVANRSAGR